MLETKTGSKRFRSKLEDRKLIDRKDMSTKYESGQLVFKI